MVKKSSGQKKREKKVKPNPEFEKTLSNNIKATNPDFRESRLRGDKKYTHNCANVTYAFEARMRGEDVVAASRSPSMASTHWADAMKGQSWSQLLGSDGAETLRNTEAFMRAQGPNARFAIALNWQNGGGHIFNAINDGNGNPRFIEAQSGHELTRQQMIDRFNGANLNASASTTRPIRHYDRKQRKFIVTGERAVKTDTPEISRIDHLQFDKRYRRLWDSSRRKNQGYTFHYIHD